MYRGNPTDIRPSRGSHSLTMPCSTPFLNGVSWCTRPRDIHHRSGPWSIPRRNERDSASRPRSNHRATPVPRTNPVEQMRRPRASHCVCLPCCRPWTHRARHFRRPFACPYRSKPWRRPRVSRRTSHSIAPFRWKMIHATLRPRTRYSKANPAGQLGPIKARSTALRSTLGMRRRPIGRVSPLTNHPTTPLATGAKRRVMPMPTIDEECGQRARRGRRDGERAGALGGGDAAGVLLGTSRTAPPRRPGAAPGSAAAAG